MKKRNPDLLSLIIITAVMILILRIFIGPTIVCGTSMENTLHDGDYMIVYRYAYLNSEPERGDIVVLQSTISDDDDGFKLLLKRVVGLPGDDIRIDNDQLYINGKAYREDYLKDGITPQRDTPADDETYTVPEGMYFCLGDNRVVSIDSRSSRVGAVSKDDIRGRIVLRLYPLSSIKAF